MNFHRFSILIKILYRASVKYPNCNITNSVTGDCNFSLSLFRPHK